MQYAIKSKLAIQRRGWYSLVVTQPRTSSQLVCVQREFVRARVLARVYVCVCVCVYCLTCMVIFYQLSPLTFQVTANSCNATIRPSPPKTVSIREVTFSNTGISKGGGANPSPPALQASAHGTGPLYELFSFSILRT